MFLAHLDRVKDKADFVRVGYVMHEGGADHLWPDLVSKWLDSVAGARAVEFLQKLRPAARGC